MNKKLFIGATVVTAAAVAGYLYYRHVSLDTWEPVKGEHEAKDLGPNLDLQEALKGLDEDNG